MTGNMFTPPDDLIRVVRCKDCVHYKSMYRKPDQCWCTDMMALCGATPDDYCSRGERRTDHAEDHD